MLLAGGGRLPGTDCYQQKVVAQGTEWKSIVQETFDPLQTRKQGRVSI
jgi:hypothetical protein